MSTTDASAPPSGWPVYDITFADAVKRGFRQYALFNGRASRAEFWYWYLFVVGGLLILLAPTIAIGSATSTSDGEPGAFFAVGGVITAVFYLAVLLPTIAAACRRLHDAGFSGLFLLLGLVTGLIPLVMCVLPTSPAATRFGQPAPYGLPPAGYAPTPGQDPQQGYGAPQPYAPQPYAPQQGYGAAPPQQGHDGQPAPQGHGQPDEPRQG